jgi:SAM-dependent methyltransferase
MTQTIASFDEVLRQVAAWRQKPAPFTRGEALFWDDPHISSQMLAAHLDPQIDAASRRPETIDRTVAWMVDSLGLQPGQAVLDLGCGPGLYAARLAQCGLRVTGVDYSRRSIDYATQAARAQRLDIDYRYQNYLDLSDEARYDAVLLIYGDFCPLNPDQRAALLRNVRRALKPGGRFVLDVTTPACWPHGGSAGWQVLPSGFWRPGPHLVIADSFGYPEQTIWLNQVIVLEAGGQVSLYRNWFQDYTPASITAELARGGFAVHGLWADLTGAAYSEASQWMGLVTAPASAAGG